MLWIQIPLEANLFLMTFETLSVNFVQICQKRLICVVHENLETSNIEYKNTSQKLRLRNHCPMRLFLRDYRPSHIILHVCKCYTVLLGWVTILYKFYLFLKITRLFPVRQIFRHFEDNMNWKRFVRKKYSSNGCT